MENKTTITMSHGTESGKEKWVVSVDGHLLLREISEWEARNFAGQLFAVLKNVRLVEWNGDTKTETLLEER